ncbi:MAG: class I SAM-dependent methyltransferase [Candidatus Paceibacterota bacterium]
MNILNLNLETFKQNFNVTKEIRCKYGEINTPFSLINQMISLIDDIEFNDPSKKWLDIGTGTGYFPIILFKKLFNGLVTHFPDESERATHIIRNMIYMSEIRKENCDVIEELFGKECNLFKGDFLSMTLMGEGFDFVIGNPPYNNNGLKKVPTNNTVNKKEDGKTVWIPFIKKGVDLLKQNGQMVVIIPSIWLKPDKAKMYDFMMNYKIEHLYCMNNTETNKIFNKYAQTPTCYFKLTKIENPGYVTVFDKDCGSLVKWHMREIKVIPVFGYSVLQKIIKHLNKNNKLNVLKTNLPKKDTIFNDKQTEEFPYANIRTCQLNGLNPELVIDYSNSQQTHSNHINKLVMAHKMYGFPYLDSEGHGISNRDNYVIINRTLEDLKILRDFFATKTALYLFETTRYRMKYLEKYIFELIPDVTKLPDFPSTINDETTAAYFGFDKKDIDNINKLHTKKYSFLFIK